MSAPGIAVTPEPPYYAVIFSSQHTGEHAGEYGAVAELMFRLATEQPGYLGVERAGDAGLNITVSYWSDETSIGAWREHVRERLVRNAGCERRAPFCAGTVFPSGKSGSYRRASPEPCGR